MTSQSGIDAELPRLWKGRGIDASDLPSRCGSGLRRIFGIGPNDDHATTYHKVKTGITLLADELPEDLQLVILVDMAIDRDTRFETLTKRQEWLAEHFACDIRTVRRRSLDAVRLMARIAQKPELNVLEGDTEPGYVESTWYIERSRLLLRMDKPSPELSEDRTIVTTRAGLSKILATGNVPRDSADNPSEEKDVLEVRYGGQLSSFVRVSDSFFKYAVELPKPLALGERHEYGTTVRIPDGRGMTPLCLPIFLCRCDRFELRVRFDKARLPASVWRIAGVPSEVVREFSARNDPLELDKANELFTSFDNLKPGLVYGVEWAW